MGAQGVAQLSAKDGLNFNVFHKVIVDRSSDKIRYSIVKAFTHQIYILFTGYYENRKEIHVFFCFGNLQKIDTIHNWH